MFRHFLQVFLGFLWIAACVPAAAAPIDEDGAKALKTLFERQIEYQQGLAALRIGTGIEFDGEVTVEPADGFYAVTLPYIRVTYPDGRHLDVGMISINASPHTVPGEWKMLVAIPTPLVMFDAGNRQVMRLTLGAQRFAGIWDEELGTMAKLDASYRDAVLESADPPFTHTVSEITARIDLEKDADGTWSGPGYTALKNLTYDFDNSKVSGSIGEIKGSFTLDRYNPAVMKNYREQLLAVTESRKNDPAAPMSPAHITATYNMILDGLTKGGNGFSWRYDMKDFDYAGNGDTASLEAASAEFALSGLLAGKVTASTRLGFKGLKTVIAAAPDTGLQPESGAFNLTIDNFPLSGLADLGRGVLQTASTNPQVARLALPGLLLQGPALMSEAGTTLTLKDNFISNPDYKIELNGTAKADATAQNSATAQAQAIFHGLDKILAKAQVMAASPANKNAESYRNLGRTLESLKKIAKVETGADEQFMHVFDFLMDAQGKTTINGQDAATVFSSPDTPAEPPVTPAP